MKQAYLTPQVEVEKFSAVEVMTSSEVEESTYVPGQNIEQLNGDDD